MSSLIKTMVVIAAIQVTSMFVTTAYIFDKTTDHTGRLLQQHRNELQQQFADEREQMKSFIMTAVQREVSKAIHSETK
ncbi:hypothetical protein [Pseudomonas sp. PLMAX]|uniref:hypothetical protein n=1 Tax=Pseudomonas sp. PLMAX TaxID=2201998 RepID=UPI0038BD204C